MTPKTPTTDSPNVGITWVYGYFLLTYVALLVNGLTYLKETSCSNWAAWVFLIASYLVYGVLYLLPGFLLVAACAALVSWRKRRGRTGKGMAMASAGTYTLAIICPAVIQILLYIDTVVYRLFHFHLDNGFVINLLTTKGGLDSMEAGGETSVSFVLLVAGALLLQAVLLVLVVRVRFVGRLLARLLSRKCRLAIAALILALGVGEVAAYGLSDFQGYVPVLTASNAFPLFLRITFKGLGRKMGFQPARGAGIDFKVDASNLRYPLHPLHRRPNAASYNVIVLVAESWRWDMLTPEITPHTYRFAKEAIWFRNHYSGGHETRMALFSLFYGLYGPYWFPCKNARVSPVLMDFLQDAGYEMHLYSSMTFTYPEFDRTIFARIPESQLHSYAGGGYRADRAMVGQLLDSLDRRDPGRPFFAYLFLDSPHARYVFPEECAIRKEYVQSMDYAVMSPKKDAPLIKNRYINCCYHLDTQLARIIDYLRQKKLLDSTIVVITGDHGEEFMEKGHWGHASGFPQEQIRAPLVMWVPGRPAEEIHRMTSHMDLPATLLTLLGVTNPPEDYSLGYDLFGSTQRQYTVISGWEEIACVGAEYKAIFPIQSTSFKQEQVTTLDDADIPDTQKFNAANRERLVQILRDLGRFHR